MTLLKERERMKEETAKYGKLLRSKGAIFFIAEKVTEI